jgi:hypothetical protein
MLFLIVDTFWRCTDFSVKKLHTQKNEKMLGSINFSNLVVLITINTSTIIGYCRIETTQAS